MSATFTWAIKKIVCFRSIEGKENVVHQVEWRCVGTQNENGVTYTDFSEGLAGLPFPKETDEFVPYELLTEAQVLAWVWGNAASKDTTENEVAAKIDHQINPPLVIMELPWSVTRV